jgi:hypothetical protein
MSCVAAKVVVKKIFDNKLKSKVVTQIEETVKREANKMKSKGLEYKNNCADGWILTITAEIELDGDELTIKLNTTGLGLKGRDTFQAKKSRGVKGINTDDIENEVLTNTDTAMTESMESMIKVMVP